MVHVPAVALMTVVVAAVVGFLAVAVVAAVADLWTAAPDGSLSDWLGLALFSSDS